CGGGEGGGRRHAAAAPPALRGTVPYRRPEGRIGTRGAGAAEGAREARVRGGGRVARHRGRRREGRSYAHVRARALGPGLDEAVEGERGSGARGACADRSARRGARAPGRGREVVHLADRVADGQRPHHGAPPGAAGTRVSRAPGVALSYCYPQDPTAA